MKKTAWILTAAAVMAVAGCNSGPEHPEEAEVKAALAGAYCSEIPRYRLELGTDGRYTARRSNRGAFATGVIGEKCEGNYKVVYDDEKYIWNLTLEKADKHSNPFVQCPGSTVAIWEHEKGYAKIGDFMRVVEPFDQTELKKDCGGIE